MPASSGPNKSRAQSGIRVYHLSASDFADLPGKHPGTPPANLITQVEFLILPRKWRISMRKLSVLCLLLLLCGLTVAQNTVIGGTASNWFPGYGVYAAPFVPLVTTPSVTLTTVSPSPVGASNATWGNVAGATNATLSDEFIGEPPVGVFTQPVWYGPSAAAQASEPMHGHMYGKKEQGGATFIAGASEGSWSVAQLMTGSTSVRKASRTYSNQDVDRMNQGTGTVKYRGKTERI
jgi:hypothetical protein